MNNIYVMLSNVESIILKVFCPILFSQNNPCDVPEDTSTVCETPPRLQNHPYNQTIDVHFDGVTIQFPIEYVEDPTFEMFKGIVLYDKESAIEIEVSFG